MSDTVRVPREPTEETLAEMVEAYNSYQNPLDRGYAQQEEGMRLAYRAMLSAAPQSSDGWIPVGERLPPVNPLNSANSEVVLVYAPDGSVGFKIRTAYMWYEQEYWHPGDGTYPTHWMPLPSPPEKDNDPGEVTLP